MADPRTQSTGAPFASDAGVERLLLEAGFTHVRTTAVIVPVRFDDAEHLGAMDVVGWSTAHVGGRPCREQAATFARPRTRSSTAAEMSTGASGLTSWLVSPWADANAAPGSPI